MCNKCYKQRQKRYQQERQANPVALRKQKEYRIIREYGVSIDQYDYNMSTSDCCQICGFVEEPSDNRNYKRKLVYDHCHVTMKFRGVLCDSCNTALGKLGDNIAGLKKAIDYLNKTENLERKDV